MTKKHFIAVAKAIAALPASKEKSAVVEQLCGTFRQLNERFDANRFRDACDDEPLDTRAVRPNPITPVNY